MSKISKNKTEIRKKIEAGKMYSLDEALSLLVECSSFYKMKNQSLDIAVMLGVDAKKSDQNVRGATVLPAGTGKDVKVAVFTQGDNVQKAKDAGADIVGFEDLAESIKSGNMDFDVVIASPDAMRIVGQLGQILGPRGLMPNPKVGTVTPDVASAVANAKAGQVRYRTDKNGIIHCSVGKVDFTLDAIRKNIEALLVDLKKAKPSTAKGTYFKKISLSSTMGPGLLVDLSSCMG